MLNQCNFIGNLGSEVEVRHTQSGVAVASFSIACTETWVKDGEKQEATEWVRIVAWNRLAEICGEYLHKGSKVYISGKLQTRKWQDQNGNDKYTSEIIAREMKMLDSKGGSGSQGPPMPEEPGGEGYTSTGEIVPF